MAFSVQGLLANMKGTPLQSSLLDRGVYLLEIVSCRFSTSDKGNPMISLILVDPTVPTSEAVRDWLMFPREGDDDRMQFKNTQKLAQFCAAFGISDVEFVNIINSGDDGYEPIKGRKGPVNVTVGKDRDNLPTNKVANYGAFSTMVGGAAGNTRGGNSSAPQIDEEA